MSGPALQPLHGRPGIWLLFGYAACVRVLREPQLTSMRPASTLVNVSAPELDEFSSLIQHIQRWLLMRDAPRHTELRRMMNRGFSPSLIERLRHEVDSIIENLISAFQGIEQVDLIRDFAYPLPVRVICRLLGLREDLHDRCVALSNDIATWFGDLQRPPDRARVAQQAIAELEGYFAETIALRRCHRQEDLLDLLMNPTEAAPMSDDELSAQCVMLLFAGHETTRNLIGNGLFTLIKNSDAGRQLRQDDGLMPGAIEELLRYESPVQGFLRGVKADIEVEGIRVPAGSSITFMIGAAHRDPRQFPDPDKLDIKRSHNRHLAFGGDAHVCLGSTLARLEGRQAIAALLRSHPDVTLADDQPDWSKNFGLRGLNSLRVRL